MRTLVLAAVAFLISVTAAVTAPAPWFVLATVSNGEVFRHDERFETEAACLKFLHSAKFGAQLEELVAEIVAAKIPADITVTCNTDEVPV